MLHKSSIFLRLLQVDKELVRVLTLISPSVFDFYFFLLSWKAVGLSSIALLLT